MLAIIDVLLTTARVLLSFLSNRNKLPKRSWRSEFVSRLARDFLNRSIVHPYNWMRQRQACLTLYSPDLFKVRVEQQAFAGVSCLVVCPKSSKASKTIVYFHGGGYALGSAKGYQLTAAKLALKAKAKVILVDYRRVPAAALPAAQEDSFAVVNMLLQDDRSQRLVLMGDSAGGALCLATLKRLNQIKAKQDSEEKMLSRISACVMISPWVAPLNPEKLSIENASCDILNASITQHWVNTFFLNETHREWIDFSEVSALDIAPVDWPKLYIQVAGAEVFYNQVNDLSVQLKLIGVSHEFDVFPDQFHVFQTFSPIVPEADDALSAIAQFVRSDHIADPAVLVR